MKRSVPCAALLYLAATLACGAPRDDGLSGTAGELWCEGLCTAEQRCGDPRLLFVCRDECVAERPGLANYSAQAAALLGQCVARFTCTTLYGEEDVWNAALSECWTQAETMVEPSAHVRSFCQEYARTQFECGRWSESTFLCERGYRLDADSTMDRIEACMASPTCDQMDACVARVFGPK